MARVVRISNTQNQFALSRLFFCIWHLRYADVRADITRHFKARRGTVTRLDGSRQDVRRLQRRRGYVKSQGKPIAAARRSERVGPPDESGAYEKLRQGLAH